MARRGWYEKYIGYCFNDDGEQVILEDVYRYNDGRLCFELYYPDTDERCITDYQEFKHIAHQTDLPR